MMKWKSLLINVGMIAALIYLYEEAGRLGLLGWIVACFLIYGVRLWRNRDQIKTAVSSNVAIMKYALERKNEK